jgi:hypothetical protein
VDSRRRPERESPELKARIDEHGFHAATEKFNYHGQNWDIFAAHQLVTGRGPGVLELDEQLSAFSRTVNVDRGRALEADLSEPVLVISLPEEVFGPNAGDLVIDGWHRITRAVHEGSTELPAHFLTQDDERQCRMGETWDSLADHTPWHASRRD